MSLIFPDTNLPAPTVNEEGKKQMAKKKTLLSKNIAMNTELLLASRRPKDRTSLQLDAHVDAAWGMRPGACGPEHAKWNMRMGACAEENARGNMRGGTCAGEHAQWNMLSGTFSTERAQCNMQYAQLNNHSGTCVMEHAK